MTTALVVRQKEWWTRDDDPYLDWFAMMMDWAMYHEMYNHHVSEFTKLYGHPPDLDGVIDHSMYPESTPGESGDISGHLCNM